MRRAVAAAFIAGFFFCLLVSTTAIGRSHMVARFHKGDTPAQREHVIERNLAHARYVAAYGSGRPQHRHAKAARWLAVELADVQAVLERITLWVPPWINTAFLCIHSGEGSWTDPGAPYYGGLQMDYEFQSTYGPTLLRAKGTADHWTPTEQIHVAYEAYRSGRGFFPWPNTARRCGLI